MTTSGSRAPATSRPAPHPLDGLRVGPVITTLAAVIGAAVMFGIGVLAGMLAAAVLHVHGGSRTGLMLAVGAVLGLTSVVGSARRHLRRR